MVFDLLSFLRIEGRLQFGLIEDLFLGQPRAKGLAHLGDLGFLSIGDRALRHARFGILLPQPFHRQFQSSLRGFVH